MSETGHFRWARKHPVGADGPLEMQFSAKRDLSSGHCWANRTFAKFVTVTGPTKELAYPYIHVLRGTRSRSVNPSPCGIGPTDRAGYLSAYQKFGSPFGQ